MQTKVSEVTSVKQAFITRNQLLTLEASGTIFSKPTHWVQERVKDGTFIAANISNWKIKKGLPQPNVIRITAESIEAYRQSILIDPEKQLE